MRKNGFRSIQTRIFLYITAIVCGVVACAVLLYLLTTASNLKNDYIASSNQLTKILSSRLDDAVRQVDAIQMRVLESDTVRAHVFGDFSAGANIGDLHTRQRQFEQEVFTIVGYDLPFYHLSIYTADGTHLNFGRIYDYETGARLPEGWAEQQQTIMDLRGYKYLGGLHSPKLYEEEPAVTVSRGFSRYPLNDPRAIIEIQIAHTTLEKTLAAALLSYDTAASGVVIYDSGQSLVYPRETAPAALAHYTQATSGGRVAHPETGQSELVTKYTSGYTGWTVCLVTPYNRITAGLGQYVLNAVLVALGAVMLALMVAFWVAKNISSPIIAIKETLLAVDLDTLNSGNADIKTSYNELELLQNSVQEMQQKLERSLQDYVSMRSLSIQSRMLALQSQVNPHFLYNTLSIMAILAEENRDEQVARMCRLLVAMLRYTAQERETTTLEAEMEHTRQYAELVAIRFGGGVDVAFDLDPALLATPMPPIILQPLVENCVKYARREQKTLTIRVNAYRDDSRWYVQVCDNGAGFPREALEELWSKIGRETNRDKVLQHEIQGVGLANICLRLRLFYGEDAVFEIQNSKHGACITVGGPRERAREAPY